MRERESSKFHKTESHFCNLPDFQHDAALADALLHPQETSYSVPQLYELLRNGGMKFGRWVQQAPYAPQCGVMAQIPRAESIARLSHEEQYAAAELFRGTMVTHSVVTYRDDAGAGSTIIPSSSDAWHDYVPVRMADTICVGERLPEGAAGVLINRTHAFRDIYLPITAEEKLMFDAIDGCRDIRAIVAGTMTSKKTSPLDAARGFFERLWWYDQIVFDASCKP